MSGIGDFEADELQGGGEGGAGKALTTYVSDRGILVHDGREFVSREDALQREKSLNVRWAASAVVAMGLSVAGMWYYMDSQAPKAEVVDAPVEETLTPLERSMRFLLEADTGGYQVVERTDLVPGGDDGGNHAEVPKSLVVKLGGAAVNMSSDVQIGQQLCGHFQIVPVKGMGSFSGAEKQANLDAGRCVADQFFHVSYRVDEKALAQGGGRGLPESFNVRVPVCAQTGTVDFPSVIDYHDPRWVEGRFVPLRPMVEETTYCVTLKAPSGVPSVAGGSSPARVATTVFASGKDAVVAPSSSVPVAPPVVSPAVLPR